jgi:molybdenum cofactor cytidylyltransferase
VAELGSSIAGVVLAAGMSRRMGRPKMILPWGQTTVIGRVVEVLHQAQVGEIYVVTGGAQEQVQAALGEVPALQNQPVKMVFNPRFAEEEMASSLQVGLANLSDQVQAALVVLGDQPQIQVEVVQAILQVYQIRRPALVVPSYQMRRGHPWLIDRSLWGEVLALQPPRTLRDVLNAQGERISYLPVETDSVLRDLDTPADYAREHPQ